MVLRNLDVGKNSHPVYVAKNSHPVYVAKNSHPVYVAKNSRPVADVINIIMIIIKRLLGS